MTFNFYIALNLKNPMLAHPVLDNSKNPSQRYKLVSFPYPLRRFLTILKIKIKNNLSYIQDVILTKILLYKVSSSFSPIRYRGSYLIAQLEKFII